MQQVAQTDHLLGKRWGSTVVEQSLLGPQAESLVADLVAFAVVGCLATLLLAKGRSVDRCLAKR